jgi:hypothetical protein
MVVVACLLAMWACGAAGIVGAGRPVAWAVVRNGAMARILGKASATCVHFIELLFCRSQSFVHNGMNCDWLFTKAYCVSALLTSALLGCLHHSEQHMQYYCAVPLVVCVRVASANLSGQTLRVAGDVHDVGPHPEVDQCASSGPLDGAASGS